MLLYNFLFRKLTKFAFIINKLIISNFVLYKESLKSAHKYAFLWWNEVPGDNGLVAIIVPVPVELLQNNYYNQQDY